MVTGADIRKYRKSIGLSQIDLAERLDVSQSGLSQLESGRIAVSPDHISALETSFPGSKSETGFADFVAKLGSEKSAGATLRAAETDRHVTLTIWRWEDGFDLDREPPADLAAGLITVASGPRRMIALRMAGKTLGWVNDEVLVFVECQAAELRSGDVCLATTTRPRARSKTTTIGIARSAGARNAKLIEPLRPSRNPFSADDPAVKALLRVCYRLRAV